MEVGPSGVLPLNIFSGYTQTLRVQDFVSLTVYNLANRVLRE